MIGSDTLDLSPPVQGIPFFLLPVSKKKAESSYYHPQPPCSPKGNCGLSLRMKVNQWTGEKSRHWTSVILDHRQSRLLHGFYLKEAIRSCFILGTATPIFCLGLLLSRLSLLWSRYCDTSDNVLVDCNGYPVDVVYSVDTLGEGMIHLLVGAGREMSLHCREWYTI